MTGSKPIAGTTVYIYLATGSPNGKALAAGKPIPYKSAHLPEYIAADMPEARELSLFYPEQVYIVRATLTGVVNEYGAWEFSYDAIAGVCPGGPPTSLR
jgi:hypothetical protein